MTIEYWYNDTIDKYMFKFWCETEDNYMGIANESIEGGLKSLQNRWPEMEFVIEDLKKVA